MTTLPRHFGVPGLMACDGCGHWLTPDTSHIVHNEGCQFVDGMCRCDPGRIVCANCCPQCNGGAA